MIMHLCYFIRFSTEIFFIMEFLDCFSDDDDQTLFCKKKDMKTK